MVAIIAYIWVMVGASLGVAFALRAGGMPQPGLIGCSVFCPFRSWWPGLISSPADRSQADCAEFELGHVADGIQRRHRQ